MKTLPADDTSERRQLEAWIAQFSPEISERARGGLAALRELLPGAFELVYDNAYALVIGFGPSERPSEAVISIAIYPRKVSLCFLWGVHLPDPRRVLAGSGNRVRHVRIEDAATLKKPEVRALVRAAVARASKPFDRHGPGRLIVRAISKNRRPRRPATPPAIIR